MKKISNQSTKFLIKSDLLMYFNNLKADHPKTINELNIWDYIHVYIKYPIFKLVLCMRICFYMEKYKFLSPIFLIFKLYYRHLQIKFGTQIGYRLNPKGGFFIGHYSSIVVHSYANIGKNFILHQGTTIGTTDKGVPTIGDNVTVGANVSIIGNITIGNNCTIGAGSVVTKDIPNNCIVAGVPAKILRKIESKHRVF